MLPRKFCSVVMLASVAILLVVSSDSEAFWRRRCRPCPPCPCPCPSSYPLPSYPPPPAALPGDELPPSTVLSCPDGYAYVKCSNGMWTECCTTGGATCCQADPACVGCMSRDYLGKACQILNPQPALPHVAGAKKYYQMVCDNGKLRKKKNNDTLPTVAMLRADEWKGNCK